MSEIQGKFADAGVRVIGVTSEDPNNSLSTVKKFVKDQGSKMDFTVAFAKGHGTATAYQVRGYPSAYLIDRTGNVAWIGHPQDPEMEDLLEEMTAGSYDPVASAKKMKLVKRYKELLDLESFGRALKLIDKLIALDPSKEAYYEVDRFHCLVMNRRTRKKALGRGPEIVKKIEDPRMLAKMAMRMMTTGAGYAQKYDALALTAAQKAHSLNANEWTVLHALAYAKFLSGDKAAAVKLQEQAISAAGSDSTGELKKDLEWFKS